VLYAVDPTISSRNWRIQLGRATEARFLLVDGVAKKPRHFVNRDA
jgi:hypothetical protein